MLSLLLKCYAALGVPARLPRAEMRGFVRTLYAISTPEATHPPHARLVSNRDVAFDAAATSEAIGRACVTHSRSSLRPDAT